jgi:intracellular multiplication protein IcmJ
MLALELSVTPGAWKSYMARKSDPGFLAFSKKVFNRDRYTCQFCGFQAREFQEVINLDHNYSNNKLSNLATACVFCAQCFFIEAAGKGSFGGGTLVYLPEISQNNLSSFCHVLFCAITNETAYKSSAQAIYRSLKFRSQMVEEQFGEGTSEPWVLGQLLLDCEVPTAKAKAMLKDVRLLPSRGKFRKQIEWWADAALQELSSEDNAA